MVKQPFVEDIDIDVLFHEMAKTLNTQLPHPPNKINKYNSLLIIYMFFFSVSRAYIIVYRYMSNRPAKQGKKAKKKVI